MLLLALLMLPALACAAQEAAWSALQAGRAVVFMRHAQTEPGIGDPDGFTIADCGSQRNLSAQGRDDAKAIGAALRAGQVVFSDVLSSHWCRCLDTARIAFGRVTPARMLDSMFNDPHRPDAEKIRELEAYRGARSAPGNVVLVTHAQNILQHTGISPASGELVVTRFEGGHFRVVGRMVLTGR